MQQQQRRKVAATREAAQRRNTRRRKRKHTRRSIIPYAILVLLVLVVGIVLSFRMFLKIDSIQVEGESPYTAEQIKEASGLKKGENLYAFDPQEIEQRLLSSFNYIESATVKRKLPTRVLIEIEQVVELGALELESGYAVISERGKVLQTGLSAAPEDMLLIKGTELAGVQVNSYLDTQGNEKMKTLMSLIETIREHGFERITSIDLTDLLEISFIYEDRVKVILGSESNLDYKIRLAKTVIYEQQQAGFEGSLDVSMGKKAVEKAYDIHREETSSAPDKDADEQGEGGSSSSVPEQEDTSQQTQEQSADA